MGTAGPLGPTSLLHWLCHSAWQSLDSHPLVFRDGSSNAVWGQWYMIYLWSYRNRLWSPPESWCEWTWQGSFSWGGKWWRSGGGSGCIWGPTVKEKGRRRKSDGKSLVGVCGFYLPWFHSGELLFPLWGWSCWEVCLRISSKEGICLCSELGQSDAVSQELNPEWHDRKT